MKTNQGCGWSKLELLAKVRDIRRANPSGLTFQILAQGHSPVPNRIAHYVLDGRSVSMSSSGIRLASSANPGFKTIKYAEIMSVSCTLPNNTCHRLYQLP